MRSKSAFALSSLLYGGFPMTRSKPPSAATCGNASAQSMIGVGGGPVASVSAADIDQSGPRSAFPQTKFRSTTRRTSSFVAAVLSEPRLIQSPTRSRSRVIAAGSASTPNRHSRTSSSRFEATRSSNSRVANTNAPSPHAGSMTRRVAPRNPDQPSSKHRSTTARASHSGV